ncbi:MAG TPA: enoyl-CoA hydratase/isomerase family protein [Desulfobacteraceae bacterium]|nr:enoyl-CoA hydratase/isomerase family protein [Desulfobacteraceae bacterium]
MENVILELDNEIATVILNRPKQFNAFDLDTIKKFSKTILKISHDPSIKGLIITGRGRGFCCGGDLRWIESCGEDYGKSFHILSSYFHQGILEIRNMPKPVIAAINGLAAGGGFSLALACDFRIMERSAVLRQAYTSNGLSIDGGGTFTLPRLVGMSRAMEIATFDLEITAEKALSWGLVNEVVENGNSLNRCMELMVELKNRSLSSFAVIKRLINESFNNSFENRLEKEREALSFCGNHPNGREGIKAFLEKRKPVFNKI